jgi:hypothetical protein
MVQRMLSKDVGFLSPLPSSFGSRLTRVTTQPEDRPTAIDIYLIASGEEEGEEEEEEEEEEPSATECSARRGDLDDDSHVENDGLADYGGGEEFSSLLTNGNDKEAGDLET